jgi:membrane protein required for colicin V production
MMNVGDLIATVIIVLMALRVSLKGFVAEFSSRAGILIGFSCSFLFVTPFSTFFASRYEAISGYAMVISLTVLFLAGYISASYLFAVIDEMFVLLHLGVFDHMLGLALGTAEGAAIVALGMYLMQIQTAFDMEGVVGTSSILTRLQPLLPVVIETVKTSLSGQPGI